MSKFNALKKLATENGFTVGTFSTNGTNFYEDSVLWVGVGNPRNRNSHLVLETWDVSYSIGRNDTGYNKWARALDSAIGYTQNYGTAPDTDELDRIEFEARKQRRAERRTAKKAAKKELLKKQATLTPTTLRACLPKMPEKIVNSFGIDQAERDQLLDDPEILAELPNGRLLVKQATFRHGAGWYDIGSGPYDKPVIPLSTANPASSAFRGAAMVDFHRHKRRNENAKIKNHKTSR